MDLNNAKSLQFAFSLSDVTLYLNASRNLSLTAALQLVFNEYVFSQNRTACSYPKPLLRVTKNPN